MIQLSPATMNWDLKRFPDDARLAFLGRGQIGSFQRLTADLFLFRASAGTGPHQLLSTEEILPYLLSLPISEPYAPPRGQPRPAPIDLDLGEIDFGL